MTNSYGQVPAILADTMFTSAAALSRMLTLPAMLLALVISSWVSASPHKLPLWSFQNGQSTVFILGSVHAMRPELYPLDEPILNAFKQADRVVFEVDLTGLDPDVISATMTSMGLYKAPDNLQANLDDVTKELLATYLQDEGMSLKQVANMRPWFLMLTVGQRELEKLGYEADLGIDQHFQTLAKQQNKPILQLETFKQQISILASDPPALQALSLRASLEDRATIATDLEQLLRAWQQGDVDQMLMLTLVPVEKYPLLAEQMERLIYNRNLDMVTKIHNYANLPGTTLVVIGALHMGGERGIVKLLASDYQLHQAELTH